MMATKVPNIKKFKGDNEISLSEWILQLEAQLRALNVTDADGKWKNILLCCTESVAFTTLSEAIVADNTITYAALIQKLKDKFCGVEYKRNLETKLRSLSWKKGINGNLFIHELKTCIKDLYGITDPNTISALAMNHVVNNLEETIRKEAKIFQLHGSTNLESLIEFLDTRCQGSEFHLPSANTRTAAVEVEDDRIGKLETMVTNLCTKLDSLKSGTNENRREMECSICHKLGHDRSRCFKAKTCFKCKKVGHISRFCRSSNDKAGNTSSSEFNESGDIIKPTPRIVMKLNICDTEIDFLYDPGSQVTIMTRKAYDSLKFKPPIQEIKKSGTTVDGSRFSFEGIVYLNITFPQTPKSRDSYTLEYEPVLISSKVTTCIYGAQTESRFKNCYRDIEHSTILYTTKENKNVNVKCYREKVSATTAYVKVAKVTIIPDGYTNFVKGRVSGYKQFENGGFLYDFETIDNVEVIDLKLDKIDRTVKFPVINNSGFDLKLKKGMIMAEISEVEEFVEEGQVSVASLEGKDFDFDDLDVGGELDSGEKRKLENILRNYHGKVKDFPISKAKLPNKHEIKLSDQIPTTCAPRLIPHSRRAAVEKQLKILLDSGCIEKSTSPYSAPIVPVRKKDGSIRMCIDYRKLNTKTLTNKFPISKSEDLFDDLKGCKYFSVIDLTSAYHHILMEEQDRYKTAFTTHDEKYQWIVMPFGLSGAAYSLSASMSQVLVDLKEFTRNFFDDGIIFSKNKQDHFKHIEKVLNRFAKYGLHVNFIKSQFFKREVVFLGHILNEFGIKPERSKINEIVNITRPKNGDELRCFMGMVGFFRKFVPGFANVADVLFKLLKKGVKFDWSIECEESFIYIKEHLLTGDLLIHPDYSKPFILMTDASNKALGFALTQESDAGLQPVLYGGRSLNDSETRYATTDKELLGIFYAVKKCEFYLADNTIIVYTDHKPLIYLSTFKD